MMVGTMQMENPTSSSYSHDSSQTSPRRADEMSREELLKVLGQLGLRLHTAAQPLTTILGLTELMTQDENLDADTLQDLLTIREEVLLLQLHFQVLAREVVGTGLSPL